MERPSRSGPRGAPTYLSRCQTLGVVVSLHRFPTNHHRTSSCTNVCRSWCSSTMQFLHQYCRQCRFGSNGVCMKCIEFQRQLSIDRQPDKVLCQHKYKRANQQYLRSRVASVNQSASFLLYFCMGKNRISIIYNTCRPL